MILNVFLVAFLFVVFSVFIELCWKGRIIFCLCVRVLVALHCSLLSWKSNGKVSLVLHCSVFTEMHRLVKLPPIDDMNQALMMKTIRLILSYKAALPAGQRA